MSGKIKIGGLAFAATLVVSLAWLAFGQVSKDPCDGHYVGQALQAKFLSQYTENGIVYNGNIVNDLENTWYRYFVPGGDCIFLFRAGHIIVSIDESESGRYVGMHLDKEVDNRLCECGDPDLMCPDCYAFDFMKDGMFFQRPRIINETPKFVAFERLINFDMKLRYKLAPTWDDPNHPGVLVLSGAGFDVNFGGMAPGDTMYLADAITFTVFPVLDPEKPITYYQNSQVKVTYGELGEGGLGWEVTPIHEPFYYVTYKKVWIDKKHYVMEPEYTFHNTSLFRDISTSLGTGGDVFYFPFKLIIKRFP